MKTNDFPKLIESIKCTGCLLCKEICPNGAISTTTDELGFLHPEINNNLCLNCKKCEKVCTNLANYQNERNAYKQRYYAAINKNTEIVKKSGSGGVFFSVASEIISRGGVVYGAAYDEMFRVMHQKACNLEDVKNLMGTKYTQSFIKDIYSFVIEDIRAKRSVLFVGTPCQCAAIKELISISGLNADNLILVDLFCHGVFSPKLWKEYLEYIRNKFSENISYVSFRDKTKGWRNKHLKICTTSKNISKYCNNEASVLHLYQQNISMRDACYQCRYMNLNRVGDLSIGDFWGIERVMPKLDKNTGVSAVLVNTKKGKEIFNSISNQFIIQEFQQKDIMQQVLREPTKRNERRDEFIECYKTNGIAMILSKYGKVKGLVRLKRDFLVPLLYKTRLAGLASRILHFKGE